MAARLSMVAVLSALACVLATPAQAAFPGKNGKIAYTSFTNGVGREVVVVNPDGAGAAVLFAGDQPSWSPDGSKISFGCPFPNLDNVCTAPAHGSPVHVVPNDEPYPQTDPTWSPDGQRLGITSQASCGEFCFSSEIWRINAVDSSDPILMVDEAAQPSWSRNARIVFTSTSTGGIHVVNTTRPGSSSPLTQNDSSAASPDWSPDGMRIVFTSQRDGNFELYVMNADGSGQTRITNTAAAEHDPAWSPDGTRIVFSRSYNDLYLIDPDGTNEARLTDTPDVQDFEPAWQAVPLGYARPKGATPFLTYLVPEYDKCETPNREHGPPLAFGSCSPPQPTSDWLTVGTADSNGQPTKSVGSVRLDAIIGNPVTPADEADMKVEVLISDVRNQSDLSDYTGELSAEGDLRITDKNNDVPPGGGTDPGTLIDIPFPLAQVSCVSTADPTIGGQCNVTTTFDAQIPAAVKEGKRSIWQLSQVRVIDGGSDGLLGTTPNTVFLKEGIFVP